MSPTVFLLLWACGEAQSPPPEPTMLTPEDVTVATVGTLQSGPRLSGALEAAQHAVLRAETSGSMAEVAVEIGDRVTKGQRLGRIDNAFASGQVGSARAGLAAAQQDLANATRSADRVTKLVAAGALSPQDAEGAAAMVAAASARVEAARAQVTGAGEQASATVISAPFDGVVSARSVDAGDIITPGAPLFTIIEPSSLRLEASVPAEALSVVRAGTRVAFTVQGLPDRTFEGTISRVAPSLDPVSRQLPVLVTLPNQDGTLLAGLFASGTVAVEQQSGIIVPEDAIDESGPSPTITRVSGPSVQKVPVRLGIRDTQSERVQIVEGVAEGDVLLVGASRDIDDGTAVLLTAPGEG